jgi:tetratricopeptide (TPR) repeat protein
LTATTALLRYYRATGRYGRALEIGAEALAAAQGSAQMMNLIMFEAGLAESHAATGDRDEALAIIEDMRGRLMFPLSILVPIFALEVHLELEDVEPARAAAKELEIAIEEQQWEHLRPIWLRGVGSIHELEGDLEGALANFDGLRELQPTDDTVQYLRARCLRKLGRLDDAQSSMEKALLQRPYAARWLHEAALIAHENGQADLAETHLEHALEIWKNADAEYMPAREARETLVSWRQGS